MSVHVACSSVYYVRCEELLIGMDRMVKQILQNDKFIIKSANDSERYVVVRKKSR